MGIPLLIAMYGEYSGSLMVQVVVLQCIIWYTLLLFLFEYRGAKILIMEQFPETAASIVSFKVDSDVVSLDGRDFLETDAEIGDDGKLHVTVRKSNASRRSLGPCSLPALTPRPSNLTGAEIYSLSSSRNPTPRGSNFNHSDFYSMMGFQGRLSNFGPGDLYSVQSSRGPTPRPSNFEKTLPFSLRPLPQGSGFTRLKLFPLLTRLRTPNSLKQPLKSLSHHLLLRRSSNRNRNRRTPNLTMTPRSFTCSFGAPALLQSLKAAADFTFSPGMSSPEPSNLDGQIKALRRSGCSWLIIHKTGKTKVVFNLHNY